ncbi:PTS mannose/fructose/sorbose transporter subunit IIAB [Candidatus Enterococcus leclercqii]|uniref:PTS mannose/fructose/sorbose transporter subunit IIAB n=1 Tax=Candidatus Enterococcus leclercqii TaxID=1857218 RepID=UPI00137AFCD6|nr:PTS mannose/fructose/sorbose transporter subunit IIAB [Enterococcus sp. CU9D]
MKNIVLVSHGDMAAGVKASLEMIVGRQDQVHDVSLRPDGDDRQFAADLQAKMKTLYGSTLIITDLLGGTPGNVSLKQYLENDDVQIISGLSLPLVMEAALNPNATISELIATGRNGISDLKQALTATQPTTTEAAPASGAEDLSQYADYAGKANVVNVRIDERLIHGQVAGIWTTSLNTQRIIVINDEAATDPLQKSSLRMAAPSSMRLSVLPVDTAAHNVESGKYGNQRLFLLFKNPTDVLRYLENGGTLATVNVGNMSYKDGTREVTKSIQVTAAEEEVFEAIAQRNVKITAQLVPNDPVVDFMQKLNH